MRHGLLSQKWSNFLQIQFYIKILNNLAWDSLMTYTACFKGAFTLLNFTPVGAIV